MTDNFMTERAAAHIFEKSCFRWRFNMANGANFISSRGNFHTFGLKYLRDLIPY